MPTSRWLSGSFLAIILAVGGARSPVRITFPRRGQSTYPVSDKLQAPHRPTCAFPEKKRIPEGFQRTFLNFPCTDISWKDPRGSRKTRIFYAVFETLLKGGFERVNFFPDPAGSKSGPEKPGNPKKYFPRSSRAQYAMRNWVAGCV